MPEKMEYVCETPRGFGLYRQKNSVGGYCYYTDEVEAEIWDTASVSLADLICAINAENIRVTEELHPEIDLLKLSLETREKLRKKES